MPDTAAPTVANDRGAPPCPVVPTSLPLRARLAVHAGAATAGASRRLGLGAGGIIGGRVAMALAPSALALLAAGRRVVLVSGTNGKTTTSYLLAAALRVVGPVAHNASGANMADGALAALIAGPCVPTAVIEVDELHLAAVAAQTRPAAIVLLNLSRDQLDRGSEVRRVAAALGAAVVGAPDTTVVANADDPMVVWAAEGARRVVWVACGRSWAGDTGSCPRCGVAPCHVDGAQWACPGCGLSRPDAPWSVAGDEAVTPGGGLPLPLRLPGRCNRGNAVAALAAAHLLGVEPSAAVAAMAQLRDIAGRFATVDRGGHRLRLLLAKNPAGWAETIAMIPQRRPLLVVINAREADGRDTSWLWDVPFEELGPRPVVAAGERAADLGVRLSYAGVDHETRTEPAHALRLLPEGEVDVVANYSAFQQLRRWTAGMR